MADAIEIRAVSLDQLAVRQIIADVDQVTTGRRRIDIAHALLTIVGHEIAAKATSPREVKHRAFKVASDLKAFARDAFDRRQTREKAADGAD